MATKNFDPWHKTLIEEGAECSALTVLHSTYSIPHINQTTLCFGFILRHSGVFTETGEIFILFEG